MTCLPSRVGRDPAALEPYPPRGAPLPRAAPRPAYARSDLPTNLTWRADSWPKGPASLAASAGPRFATQTAEARELDLAQPPVARVRENTHGRSLLQDPGRVGGKPIVESHALGTLAVDGWLPSSCRKALSGFCRRTMNHEYPTGATAASRSCAMAR